MRVQDPIAIVLIVSIGAVLTACQKKPIARTLHAAEVKHTSVTVKSALNQENLGVLPLANHVSTTISLGKNRVCTITPTLLRDRNLQIILAMVTTGANGKPQGMNVARVVAEPGKPLNVSIGDINLVFTPQLASR